MNFNVIAIEREYASGGSEIGEKLAEKLGIPCYGQEILERAAAKLDLSPQSLAEIEESTTNSFLFGLAAYANVASGKEIDMLRIEQKLAIVEADIIRDLSEGPCVLVGRRAAALLKNSDKVLSVFIHAEYSARINRAIDVYELNPNTAESVLRRYDKRRANYYKATTETEWKNIDNYHMFLDSGRLGIDHIVNILHTACSLDSDEGMRHGCR